MDALLPPETAGRKIAELSRAARQQICARIHDFRTVPAGLAGLKKAEACRGGVDTRQVDPYSLQSTVRENLWIVGELLDVTGLLGGYNLHWAWASGMAAGRPWPCSRANRHLSFLWGRGALEKAPLFLRTMP